MPSCCRTCDHRNHAMRTIPSAPTLLEICLVTLAFRSAVSPLDQVPYTALNNVLNDITDATESTSHPSKFTTWSPCLADPKTVVVLTTATETCGSPTSPVFEPVMKYLTVPPGVQHVYLDLSILSLVTSSPEERIPIDIITLCAPHPGVAGMIGKRFGWDPKRSSLSTQTELGAPAAFSRPGDLIRDFWAWAELHPGDPVSPSSSLGSAYEGVLRSTSSDQNNMSPFLPEDEILGRADDEALVMIFQWSSHADAERFKHPLQKSFGQNGQDVSSDLWDRHVAHPVRQLEGIGARAHKFKLELRGVGDRTEISVAVPRDRRGSRRLSVMASGFGERVSGFWK